MVPVGIDHPSEPPAILISHRYDYLRPRPDCTLKSSVGIGHDHHHPYRSSAERLGAEVLVLRRLVCHPELGTFYRQTGHYRSVRVRPEQHLGSKCRLVKLHRPWPIPDR